MGNIYQLAHCVCCNRDLIVMSIKEIPHKEFYLCKDCERGQKKEQAAQMNESKKQFEKMFAYYTRDSKCKRGHVIPCSICKAVFNESCGVK